jgi:predicted TIM-barrel fold metal-dependent hydrolase
MALLPWWDVTLAAAEARRCAAMGLRGVNINPDPHGHGLPDLSDPYWMPLWEACCAENLPVNFHIGASDDSMTWFDQGAWPSHNNDAKLAYGSTMLISSNQRVMANILISRFLEDLPELKLVSVESGISWIPFLLEIVEYEMRESGLKMRFTPEEIFQRQLYACCWFERKHLVADIRRIGEDNIMFETDYPHPTCLYPDALKNLQGAIREMTRVEREKLFSRNAISVYGLQL